jgi:hyperosmotically inducible periplasmic protein
MTNTFRVLARTFFFASLFTSLTFLVAQVQTGDKAYPAPDNTKVNERDRNQAEPTADQQKNDRTDRKITQQIRQAIIRDKSLSTYAHNVKIITQNGMVTLKGPVRTDEEKRLIEAKAAEVSGKDVKSELSVSPKS